MKKPYRTLLDEVRGCTLCASYLPFPPKPILQLHSQARILIAGQAPGLKAHDSGKPFDDASGVRLRTWLGIGETEFYNPELIAILPMGFCYPGKGPSGDLRPRPECAEQWRRRCLAQLPNIRLTLVIGRYAQGWHLDQGNQHSLTEIVKNWRAHWPEVLPLPHPSPRNNRWLKQNPWFEQEVLPALRVRVSELIAPEG
ncbi:uracil-DNA glycosylase family protein [Methylomarinum vadi]|uniref:uracil-DNA glycosylase family protein n=1 Tax=Methylomarinum vadi TaxID=438855 RepID=UPI0004DF3712|nr:uracil-DNA glycosylase family protein [Methylomarinum vadi]